MEKIRRILNKILNPGTAVVFGGIPVTALLMVYVFVLHHEDEPFTYVAYILSAYAVTILCIWLGRHGKKAKRRLQALARKNRYADRYLSDIAFKYLISLRISAAGNILYVLMKLCMGIYYHSVWLITFAVYYGLLLSMRALLLRKTRTDRLGEDRILEYKRYRRCAVLLLLMNIALTGMLILAIHENQSFHYAGILIFAVAAYDFYIIISAVVNLIKIRRQKNPILSASRVVSLASALITMLSLEMAMLTEFGEPGNDRFRNTMLAVTGGVESMIFIVLAVYMLIHASREIHTLRQQEISRRGAESL